MSKKTGGKTTFYKPPKAPKVVKTFERGNGSVRTDFYKLRKGSAQKELTPEELEYMQSEQGQREAMAGILAPLSGGNQRPPCDTAPR